MNFPEDKNSVHGSQWHWPNTPVMLLDEPTTHLDITHQVEVLDLLQELNHVDGRTIVMVLHDLNQVSRCGLRLIAMEAGEIVAEGQPATIVTPQRIENVFGLPVVVIQDPVSGTPLYILSRRTTRKGP
jgi:ABC-type cobalamin/Fe3+-siderophores transport system ATPase subunit